MKDEFTAAMLMGRLVDLLRRAPEATADHRAALLSLLDLTARRSLTVRVEDGTLWVEGVVVPSETPFAAVLLSQMQTHQLGQVHIANRVPAVDLLELLQALALDLMATGPGFSVEQRMRERNVATVSVVGTSAADIARERRQVRVTDALASVGLAGASAAHEQLRMVTAASGGARDGTLDEQLAKATTLSPVIAALDEHVPLPILQKQLDTIQARVTHLFDQGRLEQAIDAVAALVRREKAASTEEARRAYSVPLRWLLIERNLAKVVPRLLDELYQGDALVLLRRAGRDGTRVVVQHLAEAPTFAERRTLLKAVRQLEEGVEVIANMLGHHQWFVVRNMADLAGDLKIEEAVDALRRAVEHADARVRTSAGKALAKIGTAGAAWGVVKVLRDPDRDIRLAVAREIRGEGLGGLIPSLVAVAEAEQDPETQYECYRALGRIGSPAAVQALVKLAQPGGKIVGRRPSAPRVAAVEALALARGSGGNAARSALQTLSADSTREVRDAARRALERAS
jgi:HEAT repeat protein